MFLDCPAYLDREGAVRCGLPAEVRCRFTMRSTDGPVESAMIRCPAGHYFCGAIESLTWDGKDKHDPGPAAVTSRAGRDSVPGSHEGVRCGRDRRPGFPGQAGAGNLPPQHRSGLLSGPPCPPVDHHHASAPQAPHIPSRDASHHRRRETDPIPAGWPPHRRQSRNRQRAPCSHVVAGHAGAVMPGSPPDPGRPAGPVLVTGASGTIGRRLVPALVAAGHQVRAMTRSDAAAQTAAAAGAEPVCGDVTDPASLSAAVHGCQVSSTPRAGWAPHRPSSRSGR